MQEVLDLPAERLDQTLRAGKIERDHVNDDVRSKRSDARAEGAGTFLGLSVSDDLCDAFPCRMRAITFLPTAADVDDFMPLFDERRKNKQRREVIAKHTKGGVTPKVVKGKTDDGAAAKPSSGAKPARRK